MKYLIKVPEWRKGIKIITRRNKMKYLIKVPEWRKGIKIITHHALFPFVVCFVLAILFKDIAMRVGIDTEKIVIIVLCIDCSSMGSVWTRLDNPEWDKPDIDDTK